jgi:hypothetical protein
MSGDLTISIIAGIMISGAGGFWFLNKTCRRKGTKARFPFKIPRGQKRFEIWTFLILLFLFNVSFTPFANYYVVLLLPISSMIISTILTILAIIALNVAFLSLGYWAVGEPW